MDAYPLHAMSQRRLNPFAFPSETSMRFVLLIAAVLGASLFLFNMLYYAVFGTSTADLALAAQCLRIAPRVNLQDLATAPTAFWDSNTLYRQCVAIVSGHDQIIAAWMIGGVVVLLITAGVIYWLLPAWKLRRGRLAPLAVEDAPEVVAYLAELCREAELVHPPIFVWNPLAQGGGALAFGRFGRHYVRLGSALVMTFYTDRPAFRAVVLHELAHLRNSDVDKTYLAIAVWWAFVVVALAPLMVRRLLISPDWGVNANLGWRILVMTALVYLTRNALLRARETYADARASLWDGPTGGLRRVLDALSPLPAGRWQALWSLHPDPARRRLLLDDTSDMFHTGFWDALATGLAATVAFESVETLLYYLTETAHQPVLAPLLASLLFASLAAGIVGLGVWRATFAALARGTAPYGLRRLALGLGLGIVAGPALSFDAVLSTTQPTATNMAASSGFVIVWGSVVVISLLFFLWWVMAGATSWLEVVVSRHSPRPVYTVGLVAAAVVCAIWLGSLLFLRLLDGEFLLLTNVTTAVDPGSALLGGAEAALVGLGVLTLIVSQYLTLPIIVSLWAFPLAACLWRGREEQRPMSRWLFLEALPQQIVVFRQEAPRLLPVLRDGVAGGIITCGPLLLLWLGWHFVLPAALKDDAAILRFYAAQIVLAALAQAGVAACVAARATRLGLLLGLFAAFAVGSVMTAGILGLNQLFGGSDNPQFIWTTFNFVINLGALPALLASGGASALVQWLARAKVPVGKVPT